MILGAYIITSVPGMPKLDGVLEIIKRFYKGRDWQHDRSRAMICTLTAYGRR